MVEEACLFDFPKLEINKKIRLIELFGGIGSQAMALRDLGADFETYKLIEFDKYAIQSYNAIHGTNFKTTDIRNVRGVDLEIRERERFCYLMTYSFPCTDLSIAGRMKGMSKEEWQNGESTRSGLLWEVERIIKELPDNELPQVLLMENVPQVHSDQNAEDFNSWLDYLSSRGYLNFWEDLNAKDYGIPQNRDRCFCISFLSDDDFMEFTFPEPVKLDKVMKDFLEETVDEKYYIKNEKADKLIKELIESGVLGTENREQRLELKKDGCTNTITTVQKDNYVLEKNECKMLGMLGDEGFEKVRRVYSTEACCPTVSTKEDRIKIADEIEIKQATKEGSIKCKVGDCYDASYPDSKTRKGRVQEGGDVTPTITAQGGENINYVETVYRIRKLTPKECWRLMGYTDEDYEKALKVNSNTQLYKQAGNAIVKQVLMAIFSQMNIKGVKPWNENENYCKQ
jgi:DNA (cytosine-5)-methyltransferase 1